MAEKNIPPVLNVWAIAGEIGFIIAIPLIALVLLGIKLDKTFGTTPLFIIFGMLLAALVSIISITKKVKKLNV